MIPPQLLSDTTQCLKRIEAGDNEASDEVFDLLYDELRGVAQRAIAGQPSNGTLQATALVHECWLRLGADRSLSVASREHFLRLASRAMRSLLVDRARRRGALKRSNGEDLPLEAALDVWDRECVIDPLELDELLERLEQQDERLATVVQLRFFSGLTEAEVSEALGLTRRQVEHAWNLARAWLARELRRKETSPG